METLKSIVYKGYKYYNAEDIRKINPTYFKGCAKTIRLIIKKKDIPKDQFIYGYIKDKKFIISEELYARAKLYFKETWILNKMKIFEDEINKLDDLPPLIKLKKNEKFKDNDGSIIDIEVRGERKYNKCYFNINDVSKVFNINNLRHTVIDKRNAYEEIIHYKFYKYNDVSNANKISKKIYLTFKGLIRILYVSKSKKCEKFQDWANEILFTHQFGTQEQKQKIVTKLFGASNDEVKHVMTKNVKKTSAIYLFSIGNVKQLKNKYKIKDKYKDNNIVCKYGYTEDLNRRTNEHTKTYGKIELLVYAQIDPKYLSSAENDIRLYFNSLKAHIKNNDHNELVILSNENINKLIKKQYELIQKSYNGQIGELLKKIDEQNDKYKLLQKDYDILVLKKNNEILELKNQLLTNGKNKKILNNKSNDKILDYSLFVNNYIKNKKGKNIKWTDLRDLFIKWHEEKYQDKKLPNIKDLKIYFEDKIFNEKLKKIRDNKITLRGWKNFVLKI